LILVGRVDDWGVDATLGASLGMLLFTSTSIPDDILVRLVAHPQVRQVGLVRHGH